MLRNVLRVSAAAPHRRVGVSLLFFLLLFLAFDSRTLFAQDVVGTITHTGMVPYRVAVYEAGDRVFVADNADGKIYTYDGTSLAELNSVYVGTTVLGLAVHEGTGKVFALSRGMSKVAVLNAVDGSFIQYLALAYTNGYEFAVDESLGKVYAICPSGLTQIDAATLTETRLTSVGNYYVVVNPVTHDVFAWSSSPAGLAVIDGYTMTLKRVVTGVSGYGLGVNWTNNKVYVTYCATDGSGNPQPCVIDLSDDSKTVLFTSGQDATAPVFYNPIGNRAYTSSEVDGVSTVIEGATDAFFNLPMRSSTSAIGARLATNHVYFAGKDYVGVLDDVTQMLEIVPVANPGGGGTIYQDIAINQTTGRVYSVNDGAKQNFVTVLLDTPHLTRPPIYIASENFPSTLHVFDPGSDTVAEAQNAPDTFQTAKVLAMRTGGGRLYFPRSSWTGDGFQWFAGSGTRKNFASLASGFSSPKGTVGSPDGTLVYVANSGADSVAVIDEATRVIVTNVTVGDSPWGVAITPDGAKLYVANQGVPASGGDTVSVISTATNTVVATIPLASGANPWGIAINPAGTKVYVANSGTGNVSVIDTATDTVLATITVGTTPHWLAVSPAGQRLYVGNFGSSSVSVVDTGSDTVTTTIASVSNPEGIGFLPDNSYAYVVNYNASSSSSLTKIDTATFATATIVLPSGAVNYPNSVKSIALAIGDNTSKFAGRITSGGMALAGGLVRALQGGVEKGTAVSNAAGDYSVYNLLAGTYDLEFSADGYVTQTLTSVGVTGGRTAVQHVNLAENVPLAVTSLTADQVLPVAAGTPITWTATATGGTAPLAYRFWIDSPGIGWVLAQDYSASNSVVWTPGAGGDYRIQAWVRNSGSAAPYDAYSTVVAFPITGAAALIVTDLAADVPLPAATGTPITWTATATGGTAPLAYQFWIDTPGIGWVLAQDYGTSNTLLWTPSSGGAYRIQAWVRSSGSTAPYDAYSSVVSFTITGAAALVVPSLAADVPLPVSAGTPVTWTATATGGSPPLAYQFWIDTPGVGWVLAQNYGTSNTLLWTPSAGGDYRIQVWVRNNGSVAPYDAYSSVVSFSVTGTPALIVTDLAADVPLPAAAGTPITWTATATGGSPPLAYQFWIDVPNVGWVLAQGYSTANTLLWTPSAGGDYRIQVWVRNNGSVVPYDAYSSVVSFSITGAPALLVTDVSADVPLPAAAGTPITWTATAIGGTAPLTYQFWIATPDVGWVLAQDYSTATTLLWTPSGGGTYAIQVWVRNSGSAAMYDAYSSVIPFTITGGVSLDGNWSGLTAQGKPISFSVAGGTLTSLSFGSLIVGGGGCTVNSTTTSSPISQAISSNAFSWSTTPAPGALSYSISGSFGSSSASSGTLNFTLTEIPGVPGCYGSGSTTWTAGKT